MAKNKTIFVCSECGNESSKWLGKCPACNSWNTFYEQKIIESKNSSLKSKDSKSNIPQKLNSYEAKETLKTSTGFSELDRVLGGGLVKGSLILLGGEPGIGQSTLILQICDKVKGEGKVLYVSGEESAEQIKLRADRLGIDNEDILFLGETDIDIVKYGDQCEKNVYQHWDSHKKKNRIFIASNAFHAYSSLSIQADI